MVRIGPRYVRNGFLHNFLPKKGERSAAGKHHGVAVLDAKRHGGENSTDRYEALPWPRARRR